MSAEGFNYDNMFIRMLSRVGDAMLLSILFVLFSVPVVTFGASCTAMYYTAMKGITGDGGYVWKYFIKSFKENFKQSTVMWLMFAVVFGILGVDVWFWMAQWKTNHIGMAKPFLFVSVVLLSLASIMFLYVFPLQAKFENAVKVQMRNAFLIGIKYFPTTVLLLLISVVAVWFFYYLPVVAVVVFVLIGFGALGYLYAYFMLKCFKPYLPETIEGGSDLDFHIAEADKTEAAESADSGDAESE